MRSSVERLWPEVRKDEADDRPHLAMPTAADQKATELAAAHDELKQSLDKAEKRINRLIGEKNQLSSLLEKRDVKLEHLSRELGKYEFAEDRSQAQHSGPFDVSGRMFRSIGAVLERFGTFVAQWRGPKKSDAINPQTAKSDGHGHTPLIARLGDGIDKQVVGVLLFGLEMDEIERLLPIVERDCSSRGVRPLFLIDIDAFELFRVRGLPFEYLPSADQRHQFDSSLNWDLYLQRRLAIIRKKWDPVRLVAFGVSATETLRLWSMSPFEETPLPFGADDPKASDQRVSES